LKPGLVAEASNYFLREDELKTRFEERVIDYAFGPYQPQDRPLQKLFELRATELRSRYA
jgi:hypothetical protein